MDWLGTSTASDSTLLRQVTDLMLKKTALERPVVPVSGESRYLTQLWVFGNREPWEELYPSDPSLPSIGSLEPIAEFFPPHSHEIKEKIRAALKLLTFREKHVLVQFWSPHVVGKHQLVKTGHQPFGLGALNEELFSYRRNSEWNPFLVDKDNEEEDCGPPARVYRRGLPEWTYDITNYMPKDFQLQACASRCNLLGYLALPVFDSTARSCVGVLEVLTSSKYVDYVYEVKQIHMAFKTVNLTTPQVFDYPTSHVPSERRQNRMDKILHILKDVCDNHGLPLAQMWAVLPFSSYVAHKKVIEKSCSSFNTSCIGKVCMSTAALPFYVRDLRMWTFRESCREQHLDKCRGFVGRAFLSHGSSFCGDVSELSEEEYPLVFNARISGLTSCFTTYLRSVEGEDDDEYVLEFFLPLKIKDGRYLLNLVRTLKRNIEVTSGFELGNVSSIEGMDDFSFDIEPHTIQISTTTDANTLTIGSDSSDSEAAVTKTAMVPIQWPYQQNNPNKWGTIITHREILAGNDNIMSNANVLAAKRNIASTSSRNMTMQKTNGTFTDGEKRKVLKQGRKRKIDNLTLEAIHQHLGKPIGQAAESLGVSRSTLKRFCREHNISSWPLTKNSIKTAIVNNSKLKQDLKWSLSARLGLFVAALMVVKVKRWSCSTKRHGFLAKWWVCGKHRIISSGGCLSIYQAVQLLMSLRRWRKKTISHRIGYRDYPAGGINKGCLSIYQAVQLLMSVRRWRKKTISHRTGYRDYPAGGLNTGQLPYTTNLNDLWISPYSDFVLASPKPSGSNILDMDMLTVKVSSKEGMMKFPFHVSSGLLELEKEVAQRIKLQGRRLLLKYRDEDNDLVLISCDADVQNLLEFLGGKTTLKLHVDLADN